MFFVLLLILLKVSNIIMCKLENRKTCKPKFEFSMNRVEASVTSFLNQVVNVTIAIFPSAFLFFLFCFGSMIKMDLYKKHNKLQGFHFSSAKSALHSSTPKFHLLIHVHICTCCACSRHMVKTQRPPPPRPVTHRHTNGVENFIEHLMCIQS